MAAPQTMEARPMPEEVVVGVGNPAMSDDGIGYALVNSLRDHPAIRNNQITVTHAGTTAFLALEALSGADRGILVDAVSDGDSPPGTIHRYHVHDGDFEGAVPDVTMHDFSFADALQAGRKAYELPEEVLVVGVEPGDTSTGLDLSDAVAEQLPRLAEVVFDALDSVEAAPAEGLRTHNREWKEHA